MFYRFCLGLVLTLLLPAVGCKKEPVEPESCVNVAEGWVASDPRYGVFFRDGVQPQSAADELAAKYQLQVTAVWEGLRGFAATVPTRVAFDGLRCEPVVQVMGWLGHIYAPDGQ